ncbi:MAG TPA: PP2C family serine/threonine-protein phosphatase [Pirellulaceae bacterium]|jgi:protein phosphatase|nr:PP2C family serine/threonine-protein phosphatase [Pirellulaceae bacterium]
MPGLAHAAVSDVGMRRTNNQDSYFAPRSLSPDRFRSRGALFVVADGMGAHAAGELASKMAADGVSHLYEKYRELSPADALHKAVIDTNSEIHRRGEADPDLHQMGTTCSSLLLLPEGAVVAHVGDSRVYRLRGGVLEQLTFDHSLVWEMKASSPNISAEYAASLPKNVITRSLGPNAKVQVDREGPFPLEPGDKFLLCSDGLSGQIEDSEIGAALATLPLSEAVHFLVDLANLRGGPDNVTIVAVEVSHELLAGVGARGSVASDKAATPAPLLGWIGLVAFVLAAVASAAFGQYAIGIVFAVAGIVCGVFLAWTYSRKTESDAPAAPQRPFGRGPHVRTPREAPKAFLDKMQRLIDELAEAVTESGWQVDWKRFEDFREQAQASLAKNDHGSALRAYARGVSFLLQEIRQQQNKGDDSAVF